MERFFDVVTQRAVLILILILGITAFFATYLPRLRIDTSVTQMLVEDLPAKVEYDRLRKEFGRASDDILVVFKGEDVFSPAAFEKIGQLTRALQSVEGVMRVVSLSTLKYDLDLLGEWTLEDLRRNVNMADIFINNVVSPDGKATGIMVILKERYQIGATTEAIEKVLERFRHASEAFQVYQIGSPVIGYTLTKYAARDLRILPFVAWFVMLVVLLFCFRSLRGALLPLIAVCLVLVWTFGLMGMLDVSLSVVTMIVPILLIAVGSAYALHIMAAYFHEAVGAREESHRETVIRGLMRVCIPTVLASATTIVGFASLLFNRIQVTKEFAIFSCLGLFFMLIVLVTFIPATLSILGRPRATKPSDLEKLSWLDIFLSKALAITLDHPKTILVVSSLITLVATVGLFRIRVETTPMSYFRETAPIRKAFEDAHKTLSGVYPINVVLRSREPGYFKSPEVLGKVEAFQDYLSGIEGVDLAGSVVDMVKFEGLLTWSFRDKARYYLLPDDPFVIQESVRNCRLLDGDASVDYLVSRDFSRINITCRTHILSTADFIEFEKRVLDYFHRYFPEDIECVVTGLTMAVSHSSEAVTTGQIESLALAIVLIFLLLSILFVSPRVGFYAMLPNFFPVLVNFGVMGWFGIHLCVATSLIASIAIGLSVDDTIHYAFRFSREYKRDASRRHAMARTTRAVGKPVVFTSLAVGLGFSVLLFSTFVPTTIFGFLMLVTAASGLAADLFILPAILLRIDFVTLWDFVSETMGDGFYRRMALFANILRSRVASVVVTGFEKNFTSQDVIFPASDQGRAIYLILRGRVAVCPDTDKAGEPLGEFGKGHILSERTLNRAFWNRVTARALEPCRLLQVDRQAMDHLKKFFVRTSSGPPLRLDGVIAKRQQTSRGALNCRSLPSGATIYSFWLRTQPGE